MSDDTTDEELYDLLSHDAAGNLRELLAAGLDAAYCSGADSSTLLHLAASLGAKDCLHALLEAGADPDAEDDFENTPLSECIRAYACRESLTCARKLIEAGADANHTNDGIPLLCDATSQGCEEHLRLLLEAGADVNQRDWIGRSALHHAVGNHSAEAIRMLLAAGADPTAEDSLGSTPLDSCWGRKSEKCRALLTEALLARGITHEAKAPAGEILRPWQRRAVLLRSSACDAPPEENACWLGRVTRQRPGELWPQDSKGRRLVPLATLFSGALPEIPPALEKLSLITIYAPQEPWDEQDSPGHGCVIRSYATLEGLEVCNNTAEELTPCLLTPELLESDMPLTPDCGGDEELWAALRNTEQNDDIIEASANTHKIGGYPTYLQSAPELPEGDEFVLQISSDATAGLRIGDSGNYYFYYNTRKNSWRVHLDCY